MTMTKRFATLSLFALVLALVLAAGGALAQPLDCAFNRATVIDRFCEKKWATLIRGTDEGTAEDEDEGAGSSGFILPSFGVLKTFAPNLGAIFRGRDAGETDGDDGLYFQLIDNAVATLGDNEGATEDEGESQEKWNWLWNEVSDPNLDLTYTNNMDQATDRNFQDDSRSYLLYDIYADLKYMILG